MARRWCAGTRWPRTIFLPAVPTLVQSGNVDPGPQIHAWMPAVAVDGLGNLAIGFSLGGPQQYYGAGFTGRLATDPLGQTALPVTPLIAGRQNYQRLDSSGRNRWGDYSGLAVDPADDRTFWVFNEYAELGNRWATRIGSFVIDPAPDRDDYRIHAEAGDLLQFRTYTPFADTPFRIPVTCSTTWIPRWRCTQRMALRWPPTAMR